MTVHDYDGDRLAVKAPYAPNRNGHETAFAGSLSAILTLAGWGLLHLLLEEAGCDTDAALVVLQDATTRYDRPVTGPILAVAARRAADDVDRFLETLRRRGRGRIRMTASIVMGEVPVVRFEGRYVVSGG